MIRGTVNARLEPIVRLSVTGPTGQTAPVDCLVDTGSSGYLTLPRDKIDSLGLLWIHSELGALADGSCRWFDVYNAVIVWDDKLRLTPIEAAECVPLLGMRLLQGFDLHMSVRNAGPVTIQETQSGS